MGAALNANYLGMPLRNPLVASSGPLTGELDSVQQLDQAGIGAIVLPSLFEEQISGYEMWLHSVHEVQAYSSAESLSYFPEIQDYNVGPEEYLRLIEQCKATISTPLIASLNGCTAGGWSHFAKKIEDAGADALELNVYLVPADPMQSGTEVEAQYLRLVEEVREAIDIPLAVKIGAQFSSLPHFVGQLANAGANGVVLFNRYLEPDIDLESLTVEPRLELSKRSELRLPMRWIAILRDQVELSLAASSGLKQSEDLVKMLLVGADVCMMTSVLLTLGVDHVATLLSDLGKLARTE